MIYEDYIKSDHWKNLRLQALNRDEACVCCRSKTSLEVHHMRYRRLFDVRTDDLVTVCEFCHRQVHLLLNMKPVERGLRRTNWMFVKKIASGKFKVKNKVCRFECDKIRRRNKKLALRKARSPFQKASSSFEDFIKKNHPDIFKKWNDESRLRVEKIRKFKHGM